MADHPAPIASGETATARQPVSIPRVLILFGAVGTSILVVNGFRLVLVRLMQRTAMTELFIIAPLWGLILVWALSPYWGAARLLGRATATPHARKVIVLAALTIVAFGANSFLVTSAFLGGRTRPTADGMTIILVPLVQWIVLGLVGLRVRTEPDTHSG